MAAEPIHHGPFERPKHLEVGKLFSKTWRAPYVHGVNEVWAERTEGYWRRVEQRYGVVMSDHRNAYDEETSTITTFATVLVVLPGERYEGPGGTVH